MADVVAAAAGRVISSGKEILPGYDDSPAKPRYDVVYLLDDRGGAATHAGQIVSQKFSLGFLARALVAQQAGKPDLARDCLAKLAALQPGWRDDAFRQAKKSFPSDAVAGRIARDLAQVTASLGQ